MSQYYNTNVHSAALLYDVAPTNSDTNSSDTRGAINIMMAQIPRDSFHQFAFTFDRSNFKTMPIILDEFNNPFDVNDCNSQNLHGTLLTVKRNIDSAILRQNVNCIQLVHVSHKSESGKYDEIYVVFL